MITQTMDSRSPVLGLALAAALTFGTLALAQETPVDAAAAPNVLTEADVRAQLNSQGYVDIRNLALTDGTWNADVAKADGNVVKVHIDARTGNGYSDGAPRKLNPTEIEGALASAGYTRVRDLKLVGGFWQAKADDAGGKAVEVRIDPQTGKVFDARGK
jgi:Peptidase propeptide and YPEB domain